MSTLDKQNVNVAVSNRAKLDLSSTHITTASFMTLQPVYYRHSIPGEHITGKANVLSRLAPVAVPTYGRCRINLRTFFVPFRTVFPNFNEFITDTIANNVSTSSLVSNSPYITNQDLVLFFLGGIGPDGNALVSTVTTAVPPAPQDPYDFELVVGSTKKKFSFYGRQYYKILQSLGYRIVWDDKNTSDDTTYSALPLLCMAKVYCDWYANQAYLNSSEYLALQQMFKYNDPTGAYHLDYSKLSDLFAFIHAVCYDTGNDVYINAWDNPMAPNNGNYSAIVGADVSGMVKAGGTNPANQGFAVVLDSNGTPYIKQSAASSLSVGTEYMHDFLKSATDYVKRNQLSGAAQIDRFLTRFGIALDSAKVNRSIYVSAQSIDIDFGSVMSTANTAGAGNDSNLGDYAGQGLGRGELSFDFQCDEFGLFLVMSSIVPHGSLYQGVDRNLFHLDKLSYFTPEFDNLGCQAIRRGEVYVSTHGAYGKCSDYDAIFGFAPRYYEYKTKQDFVTGDFISPATMIGGDAWFLNRVFDDSSFNGITHQVHSLDFTRGDDLQQYNRIFNYTGNQDKFYLVYHFDVGSSAGCKSLFDTYDFEDAGKSISMNGQSAKVN